MIVNPVYQILAVWGSLFAVSLGRNLLQGFLGRLFGGRPLQAVLYIVLVVTGLVLGGDWLLMRFGRTSRATVVSKREAVEVQHDGSWTRTLSIEARYTPRGIGAPAAVYIPTGVAVYDVVQRGQSIPIRCLPLLPTFCLLKYDSLRHWGLRTATAALDRGQSLFLLGIPIVVLWLGVAEWTPERPVRRWLSRGLFALWAVALLADIARPQVPSEAGERSSGAARVTDVHFVSDYALLTPLVHLPLTHPFAVVQLAIAPAGRRDTVIAVDAVDSLAALGLEPGAAFLVTFPTNDPRAAELNGARRGFRQGNVQRNLLLTLGLLLLLVVPVLLLEVVRSRPRRSAP